MILKFSKSSTDYEKYDNDAWQESDFTDEEVFEDQEEYEQFLYQLELDYMPEPEIFPPESPAEDFDPYLLPDPFHGMRYKPGTAFFQFIDGAVSQKTIDKIIPTAEGARFECEGQLINVYENFFLSYEEAEAWGKTIGLEYADFHMKGWVDAKRWLPPTLFVYVKHNNDEVEPACLINRIFHSLDGTCHVLKDIKEWKAMSREETEELFL